MNDNRSKPSAKSLEVFLHQISQENTEILSTYSKESKFGRERLMVFWQNMSSIAKLAKNQKRKKRRKDKVLT